MFIPVSTTSLRNQDYDACLREACANLSSNGIRNYIHYGTPRQVELLDTQQMVTPAINHIKGGIELEHAGVSHEKNNSSKRAWLQNW